MTGAVLDGVWGPISIVLFFTVTACLVSASTQGTEPDGEQQNILDGFMAVGKYLRKLSERMATTNKRIDELEARLKAMENATNEKRINND